MAWDATKPANNSFLSSAEMRNNWAALQSSVGGINLAPDPTLRLWPDGDTVAPYFWTTSGAGLAIARCGTGLGDTNRKVGDFSFKLTSGGGATAIADLVLIPSGTEFTRANFLQGLSVSAMAWVRTATAAAVQIGFNDGVGTTLSAAHPGGSIWSALPVTRVLSGSASELRFRLQVAAGTIAAHISGITIVFGEVPPLYYQPLQNLIQPWQLPRIPFAGGNVTTGTDKDRIYPVLPGIVRDVQLALKTATATQALIVDFNTWDGGAFQSMFSARPQCATGVLRGGAQPDGTYRWRCFKPYFGAANAASTILAVDVDQVGVGTVGADLETRVMLEYFRRPLLEFLAHV